MQKIKKEEKMASSYTGLYIQRLSDETIHSVQIIDTAGNSMPLDPNIYTERDIRLSMEQLPDEKDYNSKK